MSYNNHYKNQVKDTGKAKKQKAGKSPRKILPTGWLSGIRNFIHDDRTRSITGIFMLMLSFVMLLAFTSYLFTWKIDQDKLFKLNWLEILLNPEIEIENWLGNFGALLSHQLINNGFGVSSFLFVLITFLLGFRILFRHDLLPLWKTLGYSLFFLLWTPVLLASLFSESYLFLGGAVGYHTCQWLNGVFGKLGTYALLFFSLMTFAIVNFNLTIDKIRDWFTEADEENIPPETESGLTLDDGGETENNPAELPADESLNTTAEDPSSAELDLELETEESAAEHPAEKPDAHAEDGGVAEQEEEGPEFDVEEAPGDTELPDEEKAPAEMNDYDPLLDLSRYQYPPIDLLTDHGDGSIQVDREELENNKNRIVDTLKNYNIGISKIKATIGPTVTLYEIVPEAGVRISKIKNLEDDIALSLAALGIRIIAPIPGKGTIGIEVPNQNPDVVSMRTVILSEKFQHAKMELPIALGKTISNETFVTDLAKMPHLLMAGATGQGKSVGLNCILTSLLYKKHPAQVKFVLVDPKKVELTLFNKIERHFLAKLPDEEEAIITDTSKVVTTLNSLCVEMDQRYELLKEAQCRNIKEYNAKFIKRKLNPNNGHRYLPYIVLVVDEFADLIMTAGKEVELPIARLAQLARAIGIHLIIATQRPSVNIITGTIKANFPSRIAFRVTSKVDSRTILDSGGAEQLIGRGDMLFSNGNDLIRLQCAFVDTPEVEAITSFIGEQQGYPDAHLLPEYESETSDGGGGSFDDMERDALFEDAARVVVINQQGSASLLQRKLKLGYNRAGRIVDQLEAAGIIGPFEGSKARQVLIPDEVTLEQHLKNLNEKNQIS
ncbi:MAG: DNA translocase FtsK [Salibacteraceae bacterium]